MLCVELARRTARFGTLGDALATGNLDQPATFAAVQHRRTLKPEDAAEALEQGRNRRGAGES